MKSAADRSLEVVRHVEAERERKLERVEPSSGVDRPRLAIDSVAIEHEIDETGCLIALDSAISAEHGNERSAKFDQSGSWTHRRSPLPLRISCDWLRVRSSPLGSTAFACEWRITMGLKQFISKLFRLASTDPPVSREFESPRVASSERTPGWQFFAELSPFTPLADLERHGSIRSSPPSESESYVGSWIERDDPAEWREIGLDPSLLPPAEFASAYGPVPVDGGVVLVYLKALRRIAESTSPRSEKITMIESLRDSPRFREIRDRIHPIGFEVVFADLLSIDGVSRAIAEQLCRVGVDSPESLRTASDDLLLGVKGIGPARLRQIRASLNRV